LEKQNSKFEHQNSKIVDFSKKLQNFDIFMLGILASNLNLLKIFGRKVNVERIAEELNAHVAQVVGHTALLYRPGRPPVLDLLSDA
jgi:RNA-binding protein YhbY